MWLQNRLLLRYWCCLSVCVYVLCVLHRVGLIGNPSDGFYGKTISFTVSNFWAEVTITESPRLVSHHTRLQLLHTHAHTHRLLGWYGRIERAFSTGLF